MNTLQAITQRRSVKHYDPDHRMSDAEINTLMEHAVLSPTSYNIQNWRFVLVRDPALRKDVAAAAFGQAQVTEASLLIVLCANLHAWKGAERYWKNAPESVQQMMVPMTAKFYESNADLQRDEAMRSCGIAAQTLMLTAKDMGYDSCPMIGFDPNKVAELIKLPDNHIITMLVVVGKPLQPARSRGGQLPLDEVVVTDRF